MIMENLTEKQMKMIRMLSKKVWLNTDGINFKTYKVTNKLIIPFKLRNYEKQ